MAEELQDASYTLPRVMLWATIINGGMMFIMAVTVVYCIGDLDAGKSKSTDIILPQQEYVTSTDDWAVLQTATGYPYIQIFYNVTGSLPATNAMTALIIILGFFGNVTVMAGSSRQLFAFARDEGMPFSRWISKVIHDRPNSRFVQLSTSSIRMNGTLTNTSPDPPQSRRPSKRHPSHHRPSHHHLPDQHRQHRCVQHRHFSRHRNSYSIIHCMYLVPRLAQTSRRIAPAISVHNGPRVRPRREFGCARVVMFGLCGCFLPWCAGSVVDDGGYELVDCCLCGCGAVECGLLCCLGEEAVCWAGGVCEEAGLGSVVL
jgi:hypothetical protein